MSTWSGGSNRSYCIPCGGLPDSCNPCPFPGTWVVSFNYVCPLSLNTSWHSHVAAAGSGSVWVCPLLKVASEGHLMELHCPSQLSRFNRFISWRKLQKLLLGYYWVTLGRELKAQYIDQTHSLGKSAASLGPSYKSENFPPWYGPQILLITDFSGRQQWWCNKKSENTQEILQRLGVTKGSGEQAMSSPFFQL